MINRLNAFKYFETILNLERKVAGARFIDFKEDYDNLDVLEQKGTMCFLGRKGLEGKHIKADAKNILCDYGAYAIGIKKPHKNIEAGYSYGICGLYNSNSVAKSIVESIHYLKQDIYGIEIGSLCDVPKADLVFIVCNTRQAMRIFQGYAYYYGAPKNVSFIGNQAMCGDMLAKPFYYNDINMSLFCEGARKYGGFSDGELGISMPLEMFYNVAYGVFMTINPVEHIREKNEITNRLKEIGVDYNFDMTASYGKMLDEYDEKLERQ